jgi:hypothetical protein
MDEITLDVGDLQFLRTLPRLTKRGVHGQTEQHEVAENKRIKRLQSRGLLRCVIDGEQSVGGFILADLLLTDAGRAALAADK